MYSTCLFCRAPFEENGQFARMPRGRRIAFDPERGRLWAVCGRCFRWSLTPVEERELALDDLERAAHDRGVVMARTDNVALLHVGRVLLIRIGRARLTETAWWRYGFELRKRRNAFESRASRLAHATFGAVQYLAESLGLADPDVSVDWSDSPLTDIARWRKFGWAAWRGRANCPFCHSTLRALRYDLSWWVYPIRDDDGRLGVGVPCPRCDPWTPEHLYRLTGARAENALRRVLAYQNIAGAEERRIRDATARIEAAGTVDRFTASAAEGRQSLWRLGSTGTVALEIALSEVAEQRMIDLDLRAVEYIWKREEELARIMDEELTPLGVSAAHLERLPIRVGCRRAQSTITDGGR